MILLMYHSRMLSPEQISQIPRTTRNDWDRFNHKDYFGFDMARDYIADSGASHYPLPYFSFVFVIHTSRISITFFSFFKHSIIEAISMLFNPMDTLSRKEMIIILT